MPTIAVRLKNEHRRLVLTQAEIAERCGISFEIWCRDEQGRGLPVSEELQAFLKEEANVHFVLSGESILYPSSPLREYFSSTHTLVKLAALKIPSAFGSTLVALMEVKLVARTLDLLEVFARERRAMSLTELARLLDVPMSSCLGLIRTLSQRGYLYELRKRGGYYPTKRLLSVAVQIDSGDSLVNVIGEHLQDLQQQVDETVVLGKLQGSQVLYLHVLHSSQPIRYSPEVGELRPLHANSIGKAILAQLAEIEVLKRFEGLEMPCFTDRTITSAQDYLAALAQVCKRGWSENIGESSNDLAALSSAFSFAGEWYAVSIAGPLPRMTQCWNKFPPPLMKCIKSITADLALD
ncbi:IclR family transcriptional regulator [Pseudomonas bohemica]|uniref:IclR family transcriptional regulator n=1 Tax=Pseudomonas bohemica TaxID=2044872 RepID=UPI0018FE869B|nr:IclR family transcriptional regulator [Pseudomonas bohemica]